LLIVFKTIARGVYNLIALRVVAKKL